MERISITPMGSLKTTIEDLQSRILHLGLGRLGLRYLLQVINPSVKVKDHDGTDRISNNNTQGPDVVIPPNSKRRLYEKDGFLAGEETPVWLAKFYYNGPLHRRYRYIRLNIDGTPMVKESLDNWNQLQEGSGFPIRKMSPIDNFSYTVSVANINSNTGVYEKRSADSNEVVYPSILLVMDYEADPVYIDDLVVMRWTLEQLVTYALAFWGTVDSSLRNIQNPTVSLRKVLGGSDETPCVYGYPRRKWTKKLLNTVSNALKDTSCMAAPKQLFRAGTPVPPILAGEFMPNEKQCELAGYEPDAWTCWDTLYEAGRSDCYYLKCSNQYIWGVTCSQVGPTLDGSFCNAKKTKICLDGECVNKN